MMQAMRRVIAEQLVDRPWYTSGSTLQVSRLTAPRVVLLGDAAHAVSAAFGQGVNSALEVGSLGSPCAALWPCLLGHKQRPGPVTPVSGVLCLEGGAGSRDARDLVANIRCVQGNEGLQCAAGGALVQALQKAVSRQRADVAVKPICACAAGLRCAGRHHGAGA